MSFKVWINFFVSWKTSGLSILHFTKLSVHACPGDLISLFPKEITVHSGIVWRDKIYSDRRQICERIEVSTIKINFLDDQK
jgi:hypothetical protein